MNKKDFHTKKVKSIAVASHRATKGELLSDLFLENKGGFFDAKLNQKLVQGFRELVEKLKNTENFDMREYKITHRFIGSTARELPRDTFDKRAKKELVQLLEANDVYPYTS